LAKLQRDLVTSNFMAIWSRYWNLFFNTNKFIHLSFNSKFPTSYFFVGNSTIQTSNSHRDLGIIISTNSSWKDHYNHIIAKAYRTLGLLRRTFSHSIDTSTKKFLYLALVMVRSQLLYCSPIWYPYLLCDITAFERIQRQATKYILNGYSSNYRQRLLDLNMLPLTYDLCDILFFIKSVQHPTNHFNINFTSSNKLSNFYSNRLPRTYNSTAYQYWT